MIPLTTTRRGLSLHIEVDASSATGLDHVSHIQCELIRPVSRKRLIHPIGAIDLSISREVTDVIETLLNH